MPTLELVKIHGLLTIDLEPNVGASIGNAKTL
jgi:hypothetical protein